MTIESIEYMTKVKENPKINNFVNRGFSEEKIQKIESKYNRGKKFPKAVREFLYLAGDFNNFDLMILMVLLIFKN